MENQKTLRNLTYDFEFQLGGVYSNAITLNDVRTMIGHLRKDMDEVNEKNLKDIHLYFREFHRTVRVLDVLTYHAVKELNETHEELLGTWSALFEKVVKQGVAEHESWASNQGTLRKETVICTY